MTYKQTEFKVYSNEMMRLRHLHYTGWPKKVSNYQMINKSY